MSVKIYDKAQKKWIIFPGTIGAPGKDAYLIAQENGYTGTKEEYAKVLTDIPKIINSIEEEPTEGSKNLITSGGVWQAIDNVHTTINNQIDVISDKVDLNTENISNIEQDITNIRTTEILDQIKTSIIDNLESLAVDKSLSANQGRILKEMIANLANLQIEVVDQLPSTGETNIIYLVKKSGSAPDIHDEYVFVDGKWEKIGNTEIDLSNYYTRDEVDAKIPVIPDIEASVSGAGNVITLIEVDPNNKHKVNATKGISVYTKQEIDEKIGSAGGGDVMASGNLAVDYIIVGAGTKSIKNSGQTLSNLALKSEIPSLSGYATQSWVTNQGYSTENTWRPVKVGSTTLNDSSTTLTIANGTGIGLTFSNGTLTITNSAPGSAYTLPVADAEVLGGIKTGFNETLANIPVHVDHEGCAYVAISKDSVVAALQYTPANVSDIPTALPNPRMLNITAGGAVRNYNGSSVSNIDLDSIYAKKLSSVDTPGKPGLYFTSSGPINVTEVYVTENNPDAIILVANTVEVTFGENYHKMDGIDSLSGGLYKCYCITYVRGVVLVNGAIYN